MKDEQPRRTVQVDLEELRFAKEDASFEHRYFLDTETGEVILVSELFDGDEAGEQLTRIDEAEPGRYLRVPRAESHEGYEDMQDFIATVRDEHLQELLEVAIEGRGAFRRFKDVLARHPAEEQRWFDFKAAQLDARARDWLADEGCEAAPPGTRK